MTSGVLLEDRDGVVVAAINRPAKRNAADLDTYRGLEAALERGAARGHVITGVGTDFSAGDDVTMFDFGGLGEAATFIDEVQRVFAAIEARQTPVVAAVDGYALGFGFELALACDLVVATPRAVFGLPEITHGAAPPNAMARGLDVMGRGWIRHLALTGRHWLSGLEAHDLGLVAELHEPGELLGAAVALAAEMARTPTFAAAKRLLSIDAEAGYQFASVIMPPLMASDTVAAARRRFVR